MVLRHAMASRSALPTVAGGALMGLGLGWVGDWDAPPALVVATVALGVIALVVADRRQDDDQHPIAWTIETRRFPTWVAFDLRALHNEFVSGTTVSCTVRSPDGQVHVHEQTHGTGDRLQFIFPGDFEAPRLLRGRYEVRFSVRAPAATEPFEAVTGVFRV